MVPLLAAPLVQRGLQTSLRPSRRVQVWPWQASAELKGNVSQCSCPQCLLAPELLMALTFGQGMNVYGITGSLGHIASVNLLSNSATARTFLHLLSYSTASARHLNRFGHSSSSASFLRASLSPYPRSPRSHQRRSPSFRIALQITIKGIGRRWHQPLRWRLMLQITQEWHFNQWGPMNFLHPSASVKKLRSMLSHAKLPWSLDHLDLFFF